LSAGDSVREIHLSSQRGSVRGPPVLDDICTKYHPSSRRPSTTEHFHEYGIKLSAAPQPPQPPEPWMPFFPTLQDFQFVEIVLESGLDSSRCENLIKLINSCVNGSEKGKFTITSYSNLQSMWEAASRILTPVRLESAD
jgi:hypothetical protein